MKNVKKSTLLIILCYFGLYLAIGLSLLLKQPFGNPPDEYNRYLIPQYIAQHGTLPNGYEESIRISGYGFSYAFQPILPYMLQGYVMRLVMQFTGSEEALLHVSRRGWCCFCPGSGSGTGASAFVSPSWLLSCPRVSSSILM